MDSVSSTLVSPFNPVRKALSCAFLALCLIFLPLQASAAADTSLDELTVLQQRAKDLPASADAHFDLAMGYARTPLLEKAWGELQKVKDIEAGYADKAIAQFEPLVAENPQNIEAHFRLAFAYYFKGWQAANPVTRALAKSEFEHILTIDPKYVWALNYLAYLTYEDGKLDEALALAKRATEADSQNAVAHFLVGQGLLKLKQPFAAAMAFTRAMQLRGLAGFGGD